MSAYWKAPVEDLWFSFFVDGKRIGTEKNSKAIRKEINRLKYLTGIDVRPATGPDIIAVKGKTIIPKRIRRKMRSMHRARVRQK